MELREVRLDQIERNPLQTREELHAIEELAASIEETGGDPVEPVVLVETAGGFKPLAGHRRAAALELLGRETTMAIVHPEGTDAEQLASIVAANTQREPLSAVEEARADQAMLDLGLKPSRVARITGRKPAAVKLAGAVAAASPKVAETVKARQASLEEAAALVEFEDDERVYDDLQARVGTGQFAHRLAQARGERERVHARAKAREGLMAARVKIAKGHYAPASWAALSRIGQTVEEHASCKGHAAVVLHDGDVDYYCATPSVHGVVTANHTDPEADRAKRETRAAWRAAAVVRREHVARALVNAPASVLLAFAAAEAAEHGIFRPCAKLTVELHESFVGSRTAPATVLAGMAATGAEKAIDEWLKSLSGSYGHQWTVDRLAPYYRMLAETGYERAECEDALFASAKRETPAPPSFSAAWDAIEAGKQSGTVSLGDNSVDVELHQVELADETGGFELVAGGQPISRFPAPDFESARQHAESEALKVLTGEQDPVDAKSAAAGEGRQAAEPEPQPEPTGQCAACAGDGRIPDKTGGGHHGTCPQCAGTGAEQPDPKPVDFDSTRIAAAWRTELPATLAQMAEGPSTFHWHGLELYRAAVDPFKGVLRVAANTARPSGLVLEDLLSLSEEHGQTSGDWGVTGYLDGEDGPQQYVVYEIRIGAPLALDAK